MKKYAFIADGVITETRDGMSGMWVNADSTLIISELSILTEAELNELGWFSFEMTEPVRDQYHTYELVTSVVDDLPVGEYTIAELAIERIKMIKKVELEDAWKNAVCNGSFVSVNANMRVDCRRNDTDNDVQNVEGILGLLEASVITSPVAWKGTTQIKELTIAELQGLRVEMLGYGAQVYQRKFAALTALDAATTLEEVLVVTF